MSRPNRLLTALMIALAGGCGSGGGSSADDAVVGRMSDRSYYRAASVERPSASGRMLRLSDLSGRFVWAEYAAPWCQPCDAQARALASLAARLGPEVEHLTVMTSDQGGYGDPATRATAERWASRHGLDPDRVVAADNLDAVTVPRHVLYSPEGQVLFIHTGYLETAAIRRTLDERTSAWHAWKQRGQLAPWMRE